MRSSDGRIHLPRWTGPEHSHLGGGNGDSFCEPVLRADRKCGRSVALSAMPQRLAALTISRENRRKQSGVININTGNGNPNCTQKPLHQHLHIDLTAMAKCNLVKSRSGEAVTLRGDKCDTQTINRHVLVFSTIRATHPAHLILLHLITVVFDKPYKS
jgi:hypothetical protein